jgi:hypothetical protein
MPTASALEAKQPPTVSEVAVAASSISAANASAVALSADFSVDSHHDEQGLTADAAQSNSPADPAEALKKVGEYCLDSHHDEQGLPADEAQSNSPDSPADPADALKKALKKVGEYCLKATTAAPTDGIVRVSQIVDRF